MAHINSPPFSDARMVLFPVGEERLLVRLSCVLWVGVPTYKREATEDRTSNHEDRRNERDGLDEHELVSLGRLVIVTMRSA
jgi:hypothetical protein